MRNLTLATVVTVALAAFATTAEASPVGFSYTPYNVPGSSQSWLFGVNDFGQFAGGYYTGSASPTSFYTTTGGARVIMNAPSSGANVFAYGINNSSTVVGYLEGSTQKGFIYSGGAYQELNVPGASDTRAYGINDAGVVVGDYNDATGFHSFTYNGGTYTTFNVPGATSTTGYGINNSGHITGLYQLNAADTFRSFLYDGTTFTDVAVPGSGFNWTRGINDAGQITGVYSATNGSDQHDFVFDGSQYLTFDLSGALFDAVWGINNSGLIVGSFADPDIHQAGFYGTIASASAGVPEPANITLLLLGLFSLAALSRRGRALRQPADRSRL